MRRVVEGRSYKFGHANTLGSAPPKGRLHVGHAPLSLILASDVKLADHGLVVVP